MCNNDCCLSMIIKQIYCQNGNRRTIYSSISSLNTNDTITLNFGYSLFISNINGPYITLKLRDSSNSFPDQTVSLSGNSYKMISLPAQNGTYRVYIIINCGLCCNN